MKIILIRHGMTAGNAKKRYIGKRTDEPLCAEGAREIKSGKYPHADAVICSPMRRCLETAAIIYPEIKPVICDDLRECDFGLFEGKNYDDLRDDPDYARWLKSGGKAPFPGGESMDEFSRRAVSGFRKALRYCRGCGTAAFVVHGGTIMAVMEKFAGGGFYDYRTKNGGGYAVVFDGTKFLIEEELL